MCKNGKHDHHHHHAKDKEPKQLTDQEIEDKLKRREFLKGAAALGLGTVALSPFAKLLKRAEVAAQVGCKLPGPAIQSAQTRSFVNLSAVGGLQFPSMIVPVDQNNQLYGNSRDMTKMIMGTPGTVRSMQTIGNPVSQPHYVSCGGVESGFYQTFLNLIHPAALPSIYNLFIHGEVPSDTVAINVSPVYGVNSQLHYAGSNAPLFSNGLGNNVVNKGETYAKAMDSREAGLQENLLSVATEINGITASAVPNQNYLNLPPNIQSSFLNSLDALSRKQFKNFLTPELADKLADIYSCNIDKIRSIDPGLAPRLDIRQNAAAVSFFSGLGVDITSFADNDPRLFDMTVVALQAQGLSLGCNLQAPENYDYHFARDASSAIEGNTNLATHLAYMLNTAYFFGTSLVISVVTDGGCGTDTFSPMVATTDRDFASGIALWCINPVEPPVRGALGHYNTATQAADNEGSNKWSHNHQKLGVIAMYNSMRLMGFDEGSIAPSILSFIKSKLGEDLDDVDFTKVAA